MSPEKEPLNNNGQTYRQCADNFIAGTWATSSPYGVINSEWYKLIIPMGKAILPELIRDIQEKPSWLVLAVDEIGIGREKESDAKIADFGTSGGSLEVMRQRVLDWASDQTAMRRVRGS
ncbi:MAG: hypothetical protein HY426_02060 [Candidatus Levybacteria bacterium]|nr:hypothetical protein [Candidatus Levybacteria bacterium]